MNSKQYSTKGCNMNILDNVIDKLVTEEIQMSITDQSLQLFLAYAKDAGNWGGTPMVGGNVDGSKEARGNLTQLKRAGLITTWVDEGIAWLAFTAEGVTLAKLHGIDVS